MKGFTNRAYIYWQ